ncbi:putative storage protein LPV [Phytophthora cinnamomi]|uniref:putative storage protein LPV n=1 Tax=Phytophthora cinnamomi TaxID=4785 RepID=UPI00355AB5EF|nr:putative storage protein LPV [Phytophthora cinnamomi]
MIVGDGKQTIATRDDQGSYSTTEAKFIEALAGEQKTLVPNAEGDITTVVVPELPADVASELSEDAQVVNVVTPSGETEPVVVVGQPDDAVQIQDSTGDYVETRAQVVESPTGKQQRIVKISDGDILCQNRCRALTATRILPNVPVQILEEIAEEEERAAGDYCYGLQEQPQQRFMVDAAQFDEARRLPKTWQKR